MFYCFLETEMERPLKFTPFRAEMMLSSEAPLKATNANPRGLPFCFGIETFPTVQTLEKRVFNSSGVTENGKFPTKS